MFEAITSVERNTGRRGTSMAASIVIHTAVISLGLFIGYVKARMPVEEEPVSVVFRAPPPPPPPPPAGKKRTTPRPEKKPIVQPKPLPQNAVIQPKEIPKVEETPPPADDSSDEDEGVEGGVEGGVVGGVVGGVIGGTLGGTGNTVEAPVLLGAGMTRPSPSADCQPPRPLAPEAARSMGITGMVLVEYVVFSDGHAGDVKLKNPTAPPVLFDAVANWLKGCPFTPSISNGKPLAVKIIQPFNFKASQ
jgi:protein TonB